MNTQTSHDWITTTVVTLGLLLVPLLMVVAVIVGARGADPPDTATSSMPQAVAAPANTASVLPTATVAAVESTRVMVQQHQGMLDQMRVSLSPAMTEQMNSDPMWQMMRSDASIALLEAHEADIDRMLARGQSAAEDVGESSE